ncbi:MAG: serine/threonine-protein kinase [Polyangiaceae bacterium]
MSNDADGGSLRPGSMLGRYELLSPIAQGGMAAVWAARQTGAHGFQKTVAVKTMLPALSEDPHFERMFLAEGRTAMRVHHPNVVEILDLGEERGVIYLVMEWLDGESLSSLMKVYERAGELLPLRFAVYVAARACRGLHAAHEVTDDEDQPLGLVHRDVSPQNVMVTFDGHVKVVDFGVAKSLGEGGGTQGGQLKGKIPYMAPEQVAGLAVDRRTDIFAMGTMLYRMTTGGLPFLVRGNDIATLRAIADQPIEPLDRAMPGYPAGLAAIVARCLEKAPDARYPDMMALAIALENVLPDLGPISGIETELATAMETRLGATRVKRKLGMREAAKSLGWAIATSESHPRLTGFSLPGGESTRVDSQPGSSRSMNGARPSSGGSRAVTTADGLEFAGPPEPGSGVSSSASRSRSGTGAVAVLSGVGDPGLASPPRRAWVLPSFFALALIAGGALALALALGRGGPQASSTGEETAAKSVPSTVVGRDAGADGVAPTASLAAAPVGCATSGPSAAPAVSVSSRPNVVAVPPRNTASAPSTTATPTATAAPTATSMGTGPDLGF